MTPGIARKPALRAGLTGLLMASIFMTASSGARADVFGGGAAAGPAGAQAASVQDRVTALENELKELKEKGVTAGAAAPVGASTAKPNLTLPPPMPGLEGLPAGGADPRERIIVKKELTYEVLGTVNDMVYVRDGDVRHMFTQKEFKAFEKEKRQKVVEKLQVDAVSGSLNFPELQAPADATGAAPVPPTTGAAPSAPPAMPGAHPATPVPGRPGTPAAAPVRPGAVPPAAVKPTVPAAAKPNTVATNPGQAPSGTPAKK